jgi:hypothetical protein
MRVVFVMQQIVIATMTVAHLTVCGKMRIKMELEVGSILKTETAFDKDMTLIHDGKEYRVILHWDWHDGFEATWLDDEGRFMSTPKWVDDEDDNFYCKLNTIKEHSKALI